MRPKREAESWPAPGPLGIWPASGRSLVVASGVGTGRAVYLAGSHIWNNLHDGMGPGVDCSEEPERFDFERYVDFLEERGHNFIRLWRWEQVHSQAAGGDVHLCMVPQPWARTGPGEAKDGKPKFDLTRFDPGFFDRLRARVLAAGERGIYVGVMLFDGWAIHLSPAPDNIEGHPFHVTNNVNDVRIESILDYQVLPLDPKVEEIQETYIRKVIDTVHDLPNVLYEVENESSGGGSVDEAFAYALGPEGTAGWGDSTEWQYWVIDRVRQYTEERGYDAHPKRTVVRERRRVDLTGLRRRNLRRRRVPDDAWRAAVPVAGGPAARRRAKGHRQRYGSLRAGSRRCPVGVEVVHPRPPSDPDGLRPHRRRRSGRSLGRRPHVVRRIRGGSVGHGRHGAAGKPTRSDPDATARRAEFDGLRVGERGQRIRRPAAERDQRLVYRQAHAWLLRGRMVRRRAETACARRSRLGGWGLVDPFSPPVRSQRTRRARLEEDVSAAVFTKPAPLLAIDMAVVYLTPFVEFYRKNNPKGMAGCSADIEQATVTMADAALRSRARSKTPRHGSSIRSSEPSWSARSCSTPG